MRRELLNCIHTFHCQIHSRTTTRTMISHVKCRNSLYPYSRKPVNRLFVPDDKVPWSVNWPEYDPPSFSVVTKQSWEDSDLTDPNFKPKWNVVDSAVNRRSFIGQYKLLDGVPLNIVGRTGLKGRGRLGKWGPNHAADPIVTRWKRNSDGYKVYHSETKKPVLQFVAIQRSDTGEWALPGGMVDSGESVNETLKREFCEEAINTLSLSDTQKEGISRNIGDFFNHGQKIYQGYVDDPRNTDNSWMETTVTNFHDDTGEIVGEFPLMAGDDATNVRWTDLNHDLKLYANHADFLREVSCRLESHG